MKTANDTRSMDLFPHLKTYFNRPPPSFEMITVGSLDEIKDLLASWDVESNTVTKVELKISFYRSAA